MAVELGLSFDELAPWGPQMTYWQDEARTLPVDLTGKTIKWSIFPHDTPDTPTLVFSKAGNNTGDITPAFSEAQIATLDPDVKYRFMFELWVGSAIEQRVWKGWLDRDARAA